MCVVYQYEPPAEGGHYRALMYFDHHYYAAIVVPTAEPQPGEQRHFGEQVEPPRRGRARVLLSCGHRHRTPAVAKRCSSRLPLLSPPIRCPFCGGPVFYEEIVNGVVTRDGNLVFREVREREFTCPNRHTVPVAADDEGRFQLEEAGEGA